LKINYRSIIIVVPLKLRTTTKSTEIETRVLHYSDFNPFLALNYCLPFFFPLFFTISEYQRNQRKRVSEAGQFHKDNRRVLTRVVGKSKAFLKVKV
jgi:hypothetical protein